MFSLKNMFIMFLINIPVSSMSKTDRYASWSTRVYADVSIEPRSDPPRLVLCLVFIAIFILALPLLLLLPLHIPVLLLPLQGFLLLLQVVYADISIEAGSDPLSITSFSATILICSNL